MDGSDAVSPEGSADAGSGCKDQVKKKIGGDLQGEPILFLTWTSERRPKTRRIKRQFFLG